MSRHRVWGRLVSGLAAWAFSAFTAMSAPDWDLLDLRAQLNNLSDRIEADSEFRTRPVSELMGLVDWARPELPKPMAARFLEPGTPAVLRWTNKRHGLAALSQIYGGRDIMDVMLAPPHDNHEALEIVSGTATLAQLRKILTHRQFGRDPSTGASYLRVPIVITRGAGLRLGPEDRLELVRNDGAYILNFGRLEIFGAEVFATTQPHREENEFVPFITTVGTGSVHASHATFRNLGFGNTEKFSGFSILLHPTMRPTERSVVDNSRFENMVTLAISGNPHVTVRNSLFFAMRRNPVLVSRAQNAVIAGNVFAGPSPTNAIRVSNGADRAQIVGNALLKGTRSGLLIASGSDDVLVAENLIWRRDGGGVKLYHADCARIEHNLILDDRQKGVEIRTSRGAIVHGNRIIGNRTSGVWVAGQPSGIVTRVTNNLIRENGSGLSSATGGRIAMAGNDLSNQFPRFLDGDITHHFRDIAADLYGQQPVMMDASEVERLADVPRAGCTG